MLCICKSVVSGAMYAVNSSGPRIVHLWHCIDVDYLKFKNYQRGPRYFVWNG